MVSCVKRQLLCFNLLSCIINLIMFNVFVVVYSMGLGFKWQTRLYRRISNHLQGDEGSHGWEAGINTQSENVPCFQNVDFHQDKVLLSKLKNKSF